MKKKILALTLALVMVTMALAGCNSAPAASAAPGAAPAADAQYKIMFETVLNEASSWYQMGQRIAANLEEKSGGRIVMECYANSQLAGGNQQKGCENMINNVTQMDCRSAMVWSVIDDKMGIWAIPFFYDSTDTILNDLRSSEAYTAYSDVFAGYGVKVAGLAEYGNRLIATNKPLTCYEDIKDMKIRVASVSLHLDSLSAFGANPMAMNWSEMYTGLQQGTVDGMEAPAQVLIDNTIYDVCKYMYDCSWVMDPGVVTINQKFYDSLPEDLQKILDEVVAEAMQWQIEKMQADNVTAMDRLSSEFGCTVTKIADEDLAKFRESMTAVENAYGELVGTDYLDLFRTTK